LFAIISDIHGNLEALEAVLRDIDRQKIREVLCLGDIVGYGPDPEACVDLVRERCRFCLSGNHDYAVLTTAVNFNPVAAEAIDCHRAILRDGIESDAEKQARWQYLEGLLIQKEEDDRLYVHGSPRDPRFEYILPTDLVFGLFDKISDIFEMIRHVCFVGHSHMPGVVDERMEFLTPSVLDGRYRIEKGKAIVNVGSVGQPRDGDNRACYVTVSDGEVTYHRISYDYQKTLEKVIRLGGVDEFVGTRLAIGR